ncbi:MAG: hypothetical protein S4CHLAM7_06670 [Chlamydiae bacterium]|nr:hypothetical protein [Chlamydiota bacterium]
MSALASFKDQATTAFKNKFPESSELVTGSYKAVYGDSPEEPTSIESIGQRTWSLVGACLGGSVGLFYGIGESLVLNGSKYAGQSKKAEENGVAIGYYMTHLIGSVVGVAADRFLNAQNPIVCSVISMGLANRFIAPYACSSMKTVMSLINGCVLGSLSDGLKKSKDWSQKGFTKGEKIGHFSTHIFSSAVKKLYGFSDSDKNLSKQATHTVTLLTALSVSSYIVDRCSNIGLSGAFFVSGALEALKQVGEYTFNSSAAGAAKSRAEKASDCARYIIGASLYASGFVEGGVVGSFVRGGVGLLLGVGNKLTRNNGYLIQKGISIPLTYLLGILQDYVSSFISQPFIVSAVTIAVMGVVFATYSKKVATKP